MMFALSTAARRALRVFLAGMICLGIGSVLVFAAAAAPAIESRIYPPVSRIEITKATWLDRQRLEIYVTIEKARPCRFIEQTWYARHETDTGGRTHVIRERIPLSFEDEGGTRRPSSRPVGGNAAGPWVLVIPPSISALTHETEVRHDCGLPWDSVSRSQPLDMSAWLGQRPP